MSQTPFGHRMAPPTGVSPETPSPEPYASAGAGRAWPVHIEKKLGISPAMLFGVTALVAAFQVLPLFLKGLPPMDVLLHTSAGVTLALLAGVMGVLWLATRDRAELTVDQAG